MKVMKHMQEAVAANFSPHLKKGLNQIPVTSIGSKPITKGVELHGARSQRKKIRV